MIKPRRRHVRAGWDLTSRVRERNASENRETMASPDDNNRHWLIALDGGTTNTRARLVDAQGTILASASRGVGVRDTAMAGSTNDRSADLKQAVRRVIADVIQTVRDRRLIGDQSAGPDAIVAAGMLSSDVGLWTVPHVVAPAGLDDVARNVRVASIPEIGDQPIHFIPGVRTAPAEGPDGWFEADLMRGEETETFGAITALESVGRLGSTGSTSPPAFVWPGSHTKLVELDQRQRIVRSSTSIAGELTQAVWNHTLLAASLPRDWPTTIDLDAADAGSRAVEQNGLGRAAFLVRIAGVTERLNLDERASFWIGAVLAADAGFLASHPILRNHPTRQVWIGGKQPLRGLLIRFLSRHHRGEVVAIDDELAETCSPRGASRIAARANELKADSRSC